MVSKRLTAYQYLLKDKLAGDKNRELIALLKDIKLAARQVSKELNSAGLNKILGDRRDLKNVHGEKVKKLDIIANDLFVNSLENGGNCAGVVSEEIEKSLIFNNEVSKNSKYIILIPFPIDYFPHFVFFFSAAIVFSLFVRP